MMNHLDGMGHHPETHSVSPSYSVYFPLTGQNPYNQSFEVVLMHSVSLKSKLSNQAINRKQVLHGVSSTSITVNVIRSLKSNQKYFMTELSRPLTQAPYSSLRQADTSPYLAVSDRLTPLRLANTTQEINTTQTDTIKTSKKHSCKLMLHTNYSTMALVVFCTCRICCQHV